MAPKAMNALDSEIGRKVRLRRQMIGMTQEQLAAHLQLTFQQVQKYEKGTNRIASGRLILIAKALKCPVSWFYEGVENADGAPEVSRFFQVTGSVEMAQAFGNIGSPKLRSALLTMATELARISPNGKRK